MIKFVFVILHYITIEDTKECVESIKKNINYDNYEIVIVDNLSPNNTGRDIQSLYRNEEKVHIILNEENLGFAKGNNIGFKYAKEVLKADFIGLINNDTVIKQKEFITKIINKFKEESYYVLGPDIISLTDKGHQNPYKSQIYTKKKLLKDIVLINMYLVLNYMRIERYTMSLRKKFKKESITFNYKESIVNKGVLHGSALIFSPLYINKYSKICDKTFMYGEEDILFYVCNKLRLKYIYYPDVEIFHKEASSTKVDTDSKSYKQLRFFYKNKIKACYILLGIMRNEKKLDSILSYENR